MMTPSESTVMGSSANMTVETISSGTVARISDKVGVGSTTSVEDRDRGIVDVQSAEGLESGMGRVDIAIDVDGAKEIGGSTSRPADVDVVDPSVWIAVSSTIVPTPPTVLEKITPGVS